MFLHDAFLEAFVLLRILSKYPHKGLCHFVFLPAMLKSACFPALANSILSNLWIFASWLGKSGISVGYLSLKLNYIDTQNKSDVSPPIWTTDKISSF